MRALAVALLLVVGCEVDSVCLDCFSDGQGVDKDGHRDASIAGGRLPDGAVVGGARDADGGLIDTTLPSCFPSDLGERCNAVDDDCDGRIDEDFDLTSNPLHCGGCNRVCTLDNGEAECRDGSCEDVGCLGGFADLDGERGCEYRCPVFPAVDELCNGVDDDCDGVVDEELPSPPTDLCRGTPGTPCAGTGVVCDTREGQTGWFCDYADGVEFDPRVANGIVAQETACDGVDGDCDGVVDDPWPELGRPCNDGGIGACRDVGEVRCDPQDRTATFCDLSVLPDPVPGAGPSAPELCNAVDDNCDGIVDNSDLADPDRIVDDLVHITHGGLDFWIYRHEASRPDASAGDQGVSSARACSNADVLPWTFVSYDAAAAACAAGGFRLCTAQEWLATCEGGLSRTYPYDGSYAADSCNGADHDTAAGGAIDNAVLPTADRALCESVDGVLDLSGNVKEWTDDGRGQTGEGVDIYVVRGGSYESPELGLTCQTELSQATAPSALPGLGFRCCSDTAP